MLEITIVVAVLIGLVEAIKRAFKMSSRFAPLVAIALGVVYTVFFGDLTLQEEIFTGIIAGLTASGLYSGKVVLKK